MDRLTSSIIILCGDCSKRTTVQTRTMYVDDSYQGVPQHDHVVKAMCQDCTTRMREELQVANEQVAELQEALDNQRTEFQEAQNDS